MNGGGGTPPRFDFFGFFDVFEEVEEGEEVERIFRMPRDLAIMECTECKRRNYTTTRNKRTMANRLEMKKFCPTERKRTLHKETK